MAVLGFPRVWGVIGLVAPTYVLFYGQMVPLQIAVFMVARFGTGRTPLYGALVAAGCLLAVDMFVPLMQEPGEIGFHWAVTILVWSAGFGLRTLEQRAPHALSVSSWRIEPSAHRQWARVRDASYRHQQRSPQAFTDAERFSSGG